LGRRLAVVFLSMHTDRSCLAKSLRKAATWASPLSASLYPKKQNTTSASHLVNHKVGVAKVIGPLSHVDFVAGETKIAKGEFVLGQQRMQVRFQPAMMLHAIGQRVADVRDMIALIEQRLLAD
jgi:hypothetical protein